jgi:hypothetical protein
MCWVYPKRLFSRSSMYVPSAIAPEIGKLEPGVLAHDVARCGLELLDVDVLGVDPAQGVAVNALRRMPCGLAHPRLQPKPKTANR